MLRSEIIDLLKKRVYWTKCAKIFYIIFVILYPIGNILEKKELHHSLVADFAFLSLFVVVPFLNYIHCRLLVDIEMLESTDRKPDARKPAWPNAKKDPGFPPD